MFSRDITILNLIEFREVNSEMKCAHQWRLGKGKDAPLLE